MSKKNIRWSKALVIESAASFQHKTKWERACGGAHGYAIKHNFIEEATAHMIPLRKESWTKEECLKRASKFITPNEWVKNDLASYKAALNHGWHTEIVSTMIRVQKSWDEKTTKEEALKHASMAAWKKASSGSFGYAKKNGILKECTEHMEVYVFNKWLTIENCHKEALKYDTRSAFQSGSGGCYTTCLQKGWIDKICSHMPQHSSKSIFQKEIQAFLVSIHSGVVLNDDWGCLKNFEIDHYIPSLKLGIEDSGLHWHSEKAAYAWLKSKYKKSISWQDLVEFSDSIHNGRKRHREKLDKMRSIGHRLITIYENEWRDRSSQIKNYLKSVFGVCQVKLYARNCDIKIVDKVVANDFIEKNHIQGSNNKGIFSIGMYYQDKLVGIMEAGMHPRDNTVITLSRMCFEDGYQIAGGASKMFHHFKKEVTRLGFNKIVSWSENRWSEGNVYEKLGFFMEDELNPDYSYVKDKNIVSKQSQKKNPKKDDMSKTEYDLRLAQGYFRIYDCGKKRWALTI